MNANFIFIRSVIQPRIFVIVAFIIYMSISHYFLPRFNEGKDFLFFSQWSLFSGGIKKNIYDITWDQGTTFLFRDHSELLSIYKIDRNRLFFALQKKDEELIRRFHKEKILDACKCSQLQVAKISGSLYEYSVLKKSLPFSLGPL